MEPITRRLEVQRMMIDKISGKVAYAVVSFGGFLGMGEDYLPMPWTRLKYDTNLGGYLTGRQRAIKVLQSITGAAIGIGLTALVIAPYTITTKRRMGTIPSYSSKLPE